MIEKRIKYDMQGGVRNYLGKQKQVKAPLKWQSGPDHPSTELAYITQAEKDLLVKQDLHGSLKGGANRGPSGIMSLNGWGDADDGFGSDGVDSGSSNDQDNSGYNGGNNNNNNNNDGGSNKPNIGQVTGPVSPPNIAPTPDGNNKLNIVDEVALTGPISPPKDPESNRENYKTKQYETKRTPTTDETTIDELVTSFAPVVAEKKGFWDYAKQALGILAFLNPGTTIAKIGFAVNSLDRVSKVSTLAKNLGITEKDVIASLKANFKDGSFGGFTNTTSSINPNDRIGSDNQEGDNQFFREVRAPEDRAPEVGAPEGIMKMKKTAPTENVIGSLPNANQQSVMSGPTYTRSNVANESEKGIPNVKGIGESFADVFKTDTNIPEDGEGSSALLKEYAMLLKQMEQGLLQTEGRERLNILKSRLGLAQGGITNVNMNKGKPEEVLRKLGEVLYG